MIAANYGTVSDIEVVWTIIAAAGLTLSFYNVRGAYRDLRSSRQIKNGRRMIAVSTLRVEVSRALIQVIFLALGILAMLVPDPPATLRQSWRYIAISVVFRWGLIVASSLVTFQSWTNRELRLRLLERVAERDRP